MPGLSWILLYASFASADFNLYPFMVIKQDCKYNSALSSVSPVLLANHWNWGWSWRPPTHWLGTAPQCFKATLFISPSLCLPQAWYLSVDCLPLPEDEPSKVGIVSLFLTQCLAHARCIFLNVCWRNEADLHSQPWASAKIRKETDHLEMWGDSVKCKIRISWMLFRTIITKLVE